MGGAHAMWAVRGVLGHDWYTMARLVSGLVTTCHYVLLDGTTHCHHHALSVMSHARATVYPTAPLRHPLARVLPHAPASLPPHSHTHHTLSTLYHHHITILPPPPPSFFLFPSSSLLSFFLVFRLCPLATYLSNVFLPSRQG